ncbi:hypothetical protein ACWDYH_39340 [Nocardia goodfellowii]
MTAWQVAVPTAATAVLSSALAVAVNIATGGDHSVWAWGAVVVLTVAVFAVSLWTQSTPTSDTRSPFGVDLRNLTAGRDMRFSRIRTRSSGFRARRLKAGQDMSFDIDVGHDDASQP